MYMSKNTQSRSCLTNYEYQIRVHSIGFPGLIKAEVKGSLRTLNAKFAVLDEEPRKAKGISRALGSAIGDKQAPT